MVTFTEARRIAERAVKPEWDAHMTGTMYASPQGMQDRTHYLVTVAAEEWLVDEDPEFLVVDGPMVLVEKATGKAIMTNMTEDFARYSAMSTVTDE